MTFVKGSSIAHFHPRKVCPLFFDDDNHDKLAHLCQQLPLWQDIATVNKLANTCWQSCVIEERIMNLIRKFCHHSRQSSSFFPILVTKMCFLLVATDDFRDVLIDAKEDLDFDDDRILPDFTHQVGGVLQNKVSPTEWKQLVHFVWHRCYQVAEKEHPLFTYATQCLPRLNQHELERVTLILRTLDVCKQELTTITSPSALRIAKIIQDSFPPRTFGVLFHQNIITCGLDFGVDFANQVQYSCLPTAQLELVDPNQICLTALYDNMDQDRISICLANPAESVEQREAHVLEQTGYACACLRCRFEANLQGTKVTKQIAQQMTAKEAFSMARHYMGHAARHDSLSIAESLLKQVVLVHEPQHASAWHALGAIYLFQGQFLRAQRTWAQASQEYESSCSQYPGIALQLEKINAYGYFKTAKRAKNATSTMFSQSNHNNKAQPQGTNYPQMIEASSIHTITILANKAFTTTAAIIEPRMCHQVIDWAEVDSGTKWTRQRHHAVPTHDIPVHVVPLLLSWFNDWFNEFIRPLLASLFRTSLNYFVHDAFCVRYQSSTDTSAAVFPTSNHLPIHVDESTHSFIVALNDCNHDYSGGGTYFYDFDKLIRLNTGHVLLFRGDRLWHGGEAVTSGTRYILAVFLYHDDNIESHALESTKECTDCGTNKSNRSKRERDAIEADRDDSKVVGYASKLQKQTFTFGFDIDGPVC